VIRDDRGASLVELLAVLALAGILAGLSAPLSANALETGRVRSAASFLSARFRLARIEAVNGSANVGVVFDQRNGRWELRACRDGNGNGIRRSEIAAGSDPCFDGPHDFGAMFPGVDIAVDPQLVGPAGEPGNPDPVRLGTPDIASFSATGACTPGSVFLRSTRGQQFAIRIAGANGRLRMFRYDAGPRTWLQF
jgi:prepilin-type N-terminal cleavage/methylation domain-containing protein